MQIPLALDSHCIETEIRHLYNEKVKTLLRGGDISDADAEMVELLKCMLETFDFNHLRSACDKYLKDRDNTAQVVREGDVLRIEVNGAHVLEDRISDA